MSLLPQDPDQTQLALAYGVAKSLEKAEGFAEEVEKTGVHAITGVHPDTEWNYEDREDDTNDVKTTGSKFEGGENMPREPDDPADLGRQARDMRGSQEEMYDNLSAGEQAIVDTLTENDVAFVAAYNAVREAEHRVGDVIQQAELDYDTVAEWAEGMVDELEGYDPAVDPDEFVDRAYDRLDNELGTMERNTERFRDQSDFI